MIAFYAILSSILFGNLAWWRWADRRLKSLRNARAWRTGMALFMGSQLAYFAAFLFVPSFARRTHPWLPRPFTAAVYLWSLFTLPVSLITAAALSAERAIANRRSTREREASNAVTRRQALQTIAVAAPPLLTAIATARSIPQYDQFVVRPMGVRVPGLPRELDGVRIAILADVHVGKFTRGPTLDRIAEATNQLRADLVLMVGDLIDFSLEDLDAGIAMMRRLDARCGLAMIEGNHDLIEDPDAFDRRVLAAGLPLLLDEAMTVTVRGVKVQLLGARWGAASGNRRRATDADFSASVDRLMPMRDPSAFPILLAHHPHTFDAAAAAGLPLTLSGHTHGGQLNFTPGPKGYGFGRAMFRYWSGQYAIGQSRLVVSNGVGNWFPLRINAPAEIIELTLRGPAAGSLH